jgi:hypothetical protein
MRNLEEKQEAMLCKTGRLEEERRRKNIVIFWTR